MSKIKIYYISLLFKTLQWFPSHSEQKPKVLVRAYKVPNDVSPHYLSDLISFLLSHSTPAMLSSLLFLRLSRHIFFRPLHVLDLVSTSHMLHSPTSFSSLPICHLLREVFSYNSIWTIFKQFLTTIALTILTSKYVYCLLSISPHCNT